MGRDGRDYRPTSERKRACGSEGSAEHRDHVQGWTSRTRRWRGDRQCRRARLSRCPRLAQRAELAGRDPLNGNDFLLVDTPYSKSSLSYIFKCTFHFTSTCIYTHTSSSSLPLYPFFFVSESRIETRSKKRNDNSNSNSKRRCITIARSQKPIDPQTKRIYMPSWTLFFLFLPLVHSFHLH